MRKILGMASVIVILTCCGCNEETKRVTRESSSMAEKFSALVKGGKTTREQEQAYIHAVANVLYQVDRNVRGTKAADATKAIAEAEAKNGVDLSKPLDLDSLVPSNNKPNQ